MLSDFPTFKQHGRALSWTQVFVNSKHILSSHCITFLLTILVDGVLQNVFFS